MHLKTWYESMRKFKNIYIVSLLALLFTAGCEKADLPPSEVAQDEISFSEFKLDKKHNPHLKEDFLFVQQGESVEGSGLSRYFPVVVPEFKTDAVSVTLNGEVQRPGVSSIDLRKNNVYELTSSTGSKKRIAVRMNWDKAIAHLSIKTNGRVPVNSKTLYVDASIVFEGKGFYKDYEGIGQIKGRGNSTWFMPKKPYKIKLSEDASLGGLKPEKDWVLLANYLDTPHILNALAFKTAQQLNMPYTNNAVPVEVTLNGQYAGLYTLTEQIEVQPNRVNVGKDGLLLQLDSYYDEEWKFRSAAFRLPVMVMDPDLTNISELTVIEKEFNQMEILTVSPQFPGNNYAAYFDVDAFASYFVVCLLTDNGELMHPKSTFIHKTKNGKYTMGPVWDFDWAYGYEGTQVHFSTATHPIFWNPNAPGQRFFSNILKDPEVRMRIKHKWAEYQTNHFDDLIKYIDEYTFLISDARDKDYQLWRRGNVSYFIDIANLKSWLKNRSAYVTQYVNSL